MNGAGVTRLLNAIFRTGPRTCSLCASPLPPTLRYLCYACSHQLGQRRPPGQHATPNK